MRLTTGLFGFIAAMCCSTAFAQLGQSGAAAPSVPAGPSLEEAQAWVLSKIDQINQQPKVQQDPAGDNVFERYYAQFDGCTFKLLAYQNAKWKAEYMEADLKDMDPVNPSRTVAKQDLVRLYSTPSFISSDGTDPPGWYSSDTMWGPRLWKSPIRSDFDALIAKLKTRRPTYLPFLLPLEYGIPDQLKVRVSAAFSHMAQICVQRAAAKARDAAKRPEGEAF